MIELKNIKKSYKDIKALKGISFKVNKNEIYGLLGPNGAGKTTTIDIISTIKKYDSGSVSIDDIDLDKNPHECKKIIGVVPQEISLYDDLSAYQNLMFWGSLYKVNKKELKEKADYTLKLLGLHDRKNEKIKTYSGGMKRRINIASALLHSPKLLLFDEPTVGIDPQSRYLIYDVIKELHKSGISIIYTTHYMEEAEKLCDRIGIIDKGEIIAEGTLEELHNIENNKEVIEIKLKNNIPIAKTNQILDGYQFKQEEKQIILYTDSIKHNLSKIISHLSSAELHIDKISLKEVNLETVFMNLTGKTLRD